MIQHKKKLTVTEKNEAKKNNIKNQQNKREEKKKTRTNNNESYFLLPSCVAKWECMAVNSSTAGQKASRSKRHGDISCESSVLLLILEKHSGNLHTTRTKTRIWEKKITDKS